MATHRSIVELEGLTDEQRRVVKAGNTIVGAFPQGLTKAQLSAWIAKRFSVDRG